MLNLAYGCLLLFFVIYLKYFIKKNENCNKKEKKRNWFTKGYLNEAVDIKKHFSLDFSNSEFGITWIYFCPFYSINKHNANVFKPYFFPIFPPWLSIFWTEDAVQLLPLSLTVLPSTNLLPLLFSGLLQGALLFLSLLTYCIRNTIKSNCRNTSTRVFQLLNLLYTNRS